MKKNRIHSHYILITLALFLNLNIYAQKNIAGSYIGKETNRVLILNPDSNYYLLNEEAGYILYHLDTLSFGKWRKDDGFIILNSSKNLEGISFKADVKEEFLPEKDSLVIEINNPYEEYFRRIGGKRLFDYIFYIDSYDHKFGPEIQMKNNKIGLYKTKKDKIVNINITIVPNSYLYPSILAFNYLTTDLYSFKNRSSNYIKINIPNFTFEYIGYIRFRNEYVRIKKGDLYLRGELFKRFRPDS